MLINDTDIVNAPTVGHIFMPTDQADSHGCFCDGKQGAIWFIAESDATGFTVKLPFVTGKLSSISVYGYPTTTVIAAHTVTVTDQHGRTIASSSVTANTPDDNLPSSSYADVLSGTLTFSANIATAGQRVRYALFFKDN